MVEDTTRFLLSHDCSKQLVSSSWNIKSLGYFFFSIKILNLSNQEITLVSKDAIILARSNSSGLIVFNKGFSLMNEYAHGFEGPSISPDIIGL
jgi:hypothetical protein